MLNSVSNIFDYIICGSGLSGLVLLYYLSDNFPNKSILVIDSKIETLSDKTFSFWKRNNVVIDFDEVIEKSWNKLLFRNDGYEKVCDLNEYRYCTIQGSKLERFVKNKIKNNSNITFLTTSISEIKDSIVKTESGSFKSKYIFNSVFDDNLIKKNEHHTLNQHFIGIRIKTEEECFNSDIATLFDFNFGNEWNFFYILPYSRKEALVENVSLHDIHKEDLRKYIEEKLNIKEFETVYEESGISMLTDQKYSRTVNNGIINIGKVGGMLKPITGYAFMNIVKDSKNIIKWLKSENENNLSYLRGKKKYFYYKIDSLTLHIMQIEESSTKMIYETMFKNIDTDLILKFLDEETTILENYEAGKGLLSVSKHFLRAFKEDIFEE